MDATIHNNNNHNNYMLKARDNKMSLNPNGTSKMLDNLPKQFVIAMRTLFELMDDENTGYVKFVEIEKRWQDDGSKGLPIGVIDCLRKVTPSNGLLTFERFCTGLRMSLLNTNLTSTNSMDSNNNISNSTTRPPSAPLLDLESNLPKPQWNNTATVRPNNAQLPAQRTLSLPQIIATNLESDLILEPLPVIPGLYGPPKPPRMSLEQRNTNGLVTTTNSNSNNCDRLDKAEIRNALQNWQMGILMNDISRSPADGDVEGDDNGGNNSSNSNPNAPQKKTITRRREPRRHTLQNGIDYNMLKKLKQYEQEKDVLIDGLNAVEKARDWYIRKVAEVQEKMKYLGRTGTNEQWSESQKERLDLQRARVLEVNRHLASLSGSWERGGFPIHMNLALRHSNNIGHDYNNPDIVNRLKQQNRQLTDEVSKKSERITILEREKNNLLREVIQIQKKLPLSDNGMEISEEIVF